MVISEENGGFLGGGSLTDQLQMPTDQPQTWAQDVQTPSTEPVTEQPSWGLFMSWDESQASIPSDQVGQFQDTSSTVTEDNFMGWTQAWDTTANMEISAWYAEAGDGGKNLNSEATASLLDDSNDSTWLLTWHTRYKVKKYNTWFLLSFLLFVIVCGLSYVGYLFYEYLDFKSQPNLSNASEQQEKDVNMVSKYVNEYWEKYTIFNLNQYSSMDLLNGWTDSAQKLLDDDKLMYIQKKDILQDKLSKVANKIISTREETKELRERMNKDWFFPQELVDILKESNWIDAIQRSLLSLEIVKFSSAMRVFSLMDMFTTQLSAELWYTKNDIQKRLDALLDRWEKDVQVYLNACYNNPYEPVSCNNINDFDKNYKTKKDKEENTFDTKFFRSLMEFIDNRLEYSNVPSFSIVFNSFDGKSNSIGFSVEVNTSIDDEMALIEKGIKSPHIYIVSELIKLLKQSTFILGKSIEAKDIRVSPKQITMWNQKFVVNNSVMTFNLPIQKTTTREIFDYSDTYVPAISPIIGVSSDEEDVQETENELEGTNLDETNIEENVDDLTKTVFQVPLNSWNTSAIWLGAWN